MNQPPPSEHTFLGHPRGLATLFFTEFFERFSYYGMRGLLVLFLTATVAQGGLGVDNATAGAIYGLYAGAVYLLALPGGWFADRLIGQRRCVWYGGLLISAGNFLLWVPSAGTFYAGLVAIAIGTGLLKPNASAIVGDLYAGQPGERRDAGFSIFYIGINSGAIVGSILSGGIGETWGFRWGFFSAAVAMLVGLLQYRMTERYLGDFGLAPKESTPEGRTRSARIAIAGLVAFAIAIGVVVSGVVHTTAGQLADAMGWFMIVLAIAFFGSVLLFGGLDATERRRVGVIIVFCLCGTYFWAGFEQAATTFNLFARDLTDRSLFGRFFESGEHPATFYQSVNSIYIVVLAPFLAWIWVVLGRRQLDPSAPVKFAIGLVFLGLGFAVLIFAAKLILARGGKVGPEWLLMTYFLHTVGELCLSPIGLSNVTKLAPPRFVSQMMGTWFLGTAIGNLLAGRIGGSIGTAVETMPSEFLRMTAIGVGAGVVMLLLTPLLKRWMGGIR